MGRACNGMRGRMPYVGTIVRCLAHLLMPPPPAAPGLISRYALGLLFNPTKQTVAGLQPAHYISLATPHCGCAANQGCVSRKCPCQPPCFTAPHASSWPLSTPHCGRAARPNWHFPYAHTQV